MTSRPTSGEELLRTYSTRAVRFHDMELLAQPEALQFLTDAASHQVRLLGYNCFDCFDPLQGDTIHCRLRDCVDVSGKPFWDYSIDELTETLRDSILSLETEGLLFEFVTP